MTDHNDTAHEQADRELIIKAAQVMGWCVLNILREDEEPKGVIAKWRTARLIVWLVPTQQGQFWNPLESIADAWMLVDRMRELKAHFVLGSAPQNQTTAWFIDWIWAIGKRQNEVPHQDDPACLGSWTSDISPRAITLAAINAREARKDK